MASARVDALLAEGDAVGAMRLVREAQHLDPSSPHLGVRLLDACLQSNQLLCAAHGARTVLRHAGRAGHEDGIETCRFLRSARAFGMRVSRLRWCPVASGQDCERWTNRSAVQNLMQQATFPIVAQDDGQLWSGENLVSRLKAVLADDVQWRGDSLQATLNHATMQHLQGNHDIAIELYKRALATERADLGQHAQHASMLAQAHANFAVLLAGDPSGRGLSQARTHLESALRLAPAASSAAGDWTLELATLHWHEGQLKHARHALRRAERLRPDSAFARALASEINLRQHRYEAAAIAATDSDSLYLSRAPHVPVCARWAALVPTVAASWGWSASADYAELLVGCPPDHTKLTGGGWHARARRIERDVVPVALRGTRGAATENMAETPEGMRMHLPFEANSFDEVHWCMHTGIEEATLLDPGEGVRTGWGAALKVRATLWTELRRLVRPGGVVQMLRAAHDSRHATDGVEGELPKSVGFERLSLPGLDDCERTNPNKEACDHSGDSTPMVRLGGMYSLHQRTS